PKRKSAKPLAKAHAHPKPPTPNSILNRNAAAASTTPRRSSTRRWASALPCASSPDLTPAWSRRIRLRRRDGGGHEGRQEGPRALERGAQERAHRDQPILAAL